MINKLAKIESDTELCLSIKKNNKAAFDYLYSKYACTLYGLAQNAVHSQEYADEIVELTFIKIWNRIACFDNQKTSMKVWILQNLIISIQEFLNSKNINYKFKTDNFPNFSFNLTDDLF